MFLKSRLMFIYVETALHAGAGAGLGAVDLPIQRERATGYPIVQASGLKGALRSEADARIRADATLDNAAREERLKELIAVFGPDTNNAPDHAGSFATSDARILLFPVRSLKGVFAWITSLEALERWKRDAMLAQISSLPALPAVPPSSASDEMACYVSGNGVTVSGQTSGQTVQQVVLEEFAFTVRQDQALAQIVSDLADWLANNALPGTLATYWGNQLRTKLVILPDDEFRDFLTHSTEILTRVRLETDSKTVAQGALWTEEHLPADSLLYAPVHATRLRVETSRAPAGLRSSTPVAEATNVLNWITTNVPAQLQLGGDETVGRGIVGLRWVG